VTSEEVAPGSWVLTLSNGKVNPLSVELLGELKLAAEAISVSSPRVVVVTGGPKVFAAGADITQFTANAPDEPFRLAGEEGASRVGRAFLDALDAVASLPCPTIAAVNGVALGGGCELALACDFRVASDRARFGQPEILLGIIPGGGGTQRLARLVGPARAKDLVFSGRSVDAAEALAIGLVDQVVEGSDGEPGDARSAAGDLAARYAAGPREATSLAKAAIDGGLEGSLDDGLALEQRLFALSFTTSDAEAGVSSFLEHGPGHAEFD
jgi:enoyl-CoA hydratase